MIRPIGMVVPDRVIDPIVVVQGYVSLVHVIQFLFEMCLKATTARIVTGKHSGSTSSMPKIVVVRALQSLKHSMSSTFLPFFTTLDLFGDLHPGRAIAFAMAQPEAKLASLPCEGITLCCHKKGTEVHCHFVMG